MEEAGAVLQVMESGAKLSFDIAKESIELVLRFINFIIERYERSKEFKMRFGDMNTEQKKRRSGYLSAKKMKEQMERTGEACIPVTFGKELSETEADMFDRYSNYMGFPYMYIEEPVLDKKGKKVLDENGSPKTKKTYFVLESDMDKAVIILEVLNRNKQHEEIENSDLSEEQKEQMHKDVDMEASYEDNEETVQEMAQDKTEFYNAMKEACESGDYSHLESLIKNQDIAFYSNKENGNAFTAVMNKNAQRDYAKGESYFVVDAKNPKRYVELTSVRNEKQGRTDTTYKVYQDDKMVLETDDKISDAVAEQNNGWNPNWNDIRESIASAGGFKEDGHYFVFSSEAEFGAYREMFDKNIEQYTIQPEQISVNMDYAKAKEDIVSQMKTNNYYNANMNNGANVGERDDMKLTEEQVNALGTLERVDYLLFDNNMEQYATLNHLEGIASSIEAKQTELKELDLDDPIVAMEKNGKINEEISKLKTEHDLYSKYLESLSAEEQTLLSSQAEEITEEKAKNKDASKLLSNYRANKQLKESNLDVSELGKEQQEEIKLGLAHGLNESQIRSYMDKELTVEEMKLSRVGLEKGLKNTQIEHVHEVYKATKDFTLSGDVITAYKEGLTKEQVEFSVDSNLDSTTRAQFIEACHEKVDMELLKVVKEDALANKDNLLTVRTSALLQIANSKGISKEDMAEICCVRNEKSLGEIKSALKKGLNIKELKPVLRDDVTPEQVKGVANILLTEKKEKRKDANEKAPSKEQFKKAHEWAQKENAKADKSKDLTKDVAKTTRSEDAR